MKVDRETLIYLIRKGDAAILNGERFTMHIKEIPIRTE